MTKSDLEKVSLGDFQRVINNSKALLIEAQVLFDHEKYRRSFFLALTAQEEILKIQKFLEHQTFKSTFDHRTKFKEMDEYIAKIGIHFGELNIDVFLKKYGYEKYLPLNKQFQAIFKYLGLEIGKITYSQIRQNLLYNELNPEMNNAYSDANSKKAASSYIELLTKFHDEKIPKFLAALDEYLQKPNEDQRKLLVEMTLFKD